jgi:L-ribulose-5-phosphate 3-epimerase
MTITSLEVGVCTWSLQVSSLAELESVLGAVGVSVVQFGLGDPHHGTWDEGDEVFARARTAPFDISGTMIGFPGEDYTTPATIEKTGGFGDPSLRAERLEIFRWAVDRTVELDVNLLTTHAGFLPGPDHDDRTPFLDCLGEAVDYAAAKDVVVALETGQESAALLQRTLDEMDSPFLKVNFDPANMILYKSGDPIHALDVLAQNVAHVHVKDGCASKQDGVWGEELPLGEGDVGMRAYLQKLVEIGYHGPLIIEREVGTKEERIEDVRTGVAFLKKLVFEL